MPLGVDTIDLPTSDIILKQCLRGHFQLSKEEIAPDSLYIIDPTWQRFRRSMKGTSTTRKMQMLELYIGRRLSSRAGSHASSDERRIYVQVQNYVNALKRGGQLNVDGTIKRD